MTTSSQTTFDYVIDTHVLIWYLKRDPTLSQTALGIFRAAERGEVTLYVSAIVMMELYYSNKKWHLFADFKQTYRDVISKPYFEFVSLEVEDVLDFDRDAAVPEMHDRIITGLARRLGFPLITADGAITKAGLVPIVW